MSSLSLEIITNAATYLAQAPAPLTEEQAKTALGERALKPRVSAGLVGRALRTAPEETRRQLEDEEFEKLQERLVRILILVKAPVVEEAPERALKLLAGKLRAMTLRNRVLVLEKLLEHLYLNCVYGTRWPPSTPWQLITYLEPSADEPCGPAVIPSILTALKWLEELGGLVNPWPLVGNSSFVDAAAEALSGSLEKGPNCEEGPEVPQSHLGCLGSPGGHPGKIGRA